MDALKSAGRAIMRRPSVAKQSWTARRHRKLPENWTDTRETILEGMTFSLRHVGMTLVDQPKSEELAAAAVKRIVATAKISGKKTQKVNLKVTPQGITLYDGSTNNFIENISIYRISYCTVDKVHDRLFAFIAQNTLNGTLECHAYLCSRRKEAQAVALTVAQAFGVAFELWQVTGEGGIGEYSPFQSKLAKAQFLDVLKEKGKRVQSGSSDELSSSFHSERSSSPKDVATVNLLDIDEMDKNRISERNNNPDWDLEDDLDEAFSRLAVSRTNPQILDVGVMPQH